MEPLSGVVNNLRELNLRELEGNGKGYENAEDNKSSNSHLIQS